MESPILTVALIVMITAFFKKQLALSGWKVLLAAFVVSLVIGFVPLLSVTFPAIAPWLQTLVNIVILFLTAAGTVDFVNELRK